MEQDEEKMPGNIWSVIADVSNDNDRRYASLAQRIDRLERAARGTFTDDPMSSMISIAIALVALQIVLPMVGEWIAAWKKSSE